MSRTAAKDITDPISDRDVSEQSLADFPHLYNATKSISLGLDSTYVLHMAISRDHSSLAAALSNGNLSIHNPESLVKTQTILFGRKSSLTGLKFNPAASHELYACSEEGEVKLWDLRDPGNNSCVRTFSSQPDHHMAKQLISLDVNCNNTLIAAGTAKAREDAFVLFWDPRHEKMMGGYWDSHNDDVTSLTFHPSIAHRMASAGTDGTVNVFDLREKLEDDALEYCLNTESSVQKLVWYDTSDGNYGDLAILTHTEELMLWRASEDINPRRTFSRDDLCAGMRRTSTEHAYFIDAAYRPDTGLSIIGGSNFEPSPCVRLLSMRKEKRLQPTANLKIPSDMGSTTRCALLLSSPGGTINDFTLFTGGEDGYIRKWSSTVDKLEHSQENACPAGKEQRKKGKESKKPY